MKISVVIASYNRRKALACCLRTLFEQDLPTRQFEVVVVVDGSTDGTSEMLRLQADRVPLVVVQQENEGPAAARNAGAKVATGEIVLFLDDDLLCDPALLSAHHAAHSHSPQTLVFGQMKAVPDSGLKFAETYIREDFGKYYLRLNDNPQPVWPDDAWAGPNCSMPREMFLSVGGYDVNLFPRRGEDVDLGIRLWKSGACFRFAPEAIAWHKWLKSDRQCRADAMEDGAVGVRICRKYPEMRVHSWLTGLDSASMWKRCAGALATRWPAIAASLPGVPIRIFEIARPLPWAKRIGMRLFLARRNIAMLAGASREAGSWRELLRIFRSRLPVLLYHHIGLPTPHTEKLSITVTPEKFSRHMRWLHRRGYTAITPARWLAWLTRAEPLPDKPVLLTFDDAYADLARYAFPLLERYGFQSALFVISEKTDFWEGLPVMTTEQLRYWAQRGVEIGAHTRTHPDLTCVAENAICAEVSGSKCDLEREGLVPSAFAYPFGSFDERVRKSVDGVFPLAFTCEEGMNSLQTDPLLLRRTMVQPGDSILDIELRAAFGWSVLSSVRSWLRVRSRFRRVLRILKIRPRECP